jgi:hypothetical protein
MKPLMRNIGDLYSALNFYLTPVSCIFQTTI